MFRFCCRVQLSLLVVVCLSLQPLTTTALLDDRFSQAPEAAVAYISLQGVSGYVRFQTINESAVSIETNFTGLPGAGHNWHIHRFPVDLTLDPSYRCLNDYVGGHYDPLMVRGNPSYTTDCNPDNLTACEIGDLTGKFGQLSNGVASYIDDSDLLKLGGVRGIVGRSIVVHATNGDNFVCGTIRSTIEQEPDTQVVTLSATFIAPLAGVIYLRQAGPEHAIMFGKLFWVNRMNDTIDHNWHIHEDIPDAGYRTDESCTGDIVGPHFDPFERPPPSDPMYFCTPDPSNITNCEVGDLTGKHDTVNVAANPLPYQIDAFFYTDIFLNLTGVNAVIDRSIAIHAANRGGPIIACAPLVRTESRVALSFPNGAFEARQDSPYETTVISTESLVSPNINLLTEVYSTYGLCPSGRPPYNPLAVSATPSFTTPDQVAIGSLYAKHGSQLRSASSFDVTEFPLFGVNVVSSRTLQIIGSNGDRRICSAVPQPINQRRTLIAVASFSDTIEGTILFIQEQLSNGTLGQTNVIVDIRYANSSQQSTSGHNWHIHTLPPVPGQECQGNIGPHFNPFDVSLDSSNEISNYSTDCSPLSKLRCESGDLSGKHGQLTIDPPGENMTTYSYLDPNLHLYGPQAHTITGRSVGIHENIPGGPIIYCAEVQLANLTTAELTIAEPETYNRVQFVNDVARQSGVSAQSILVKHVDIGSSTANDGNTQCVSMTFGVLEFSDAAGSLVQSALCDMYRDDECLKARDDYMSLCPSSRDDDNMGSGDNTPPSSAAVLSLSLFTLTTLFFIALLLL